MTNRDQLREQVCSILFDDDFPILSVEDNGRVDEVLALLHKARREAGIDIIRQALPTYDRDYLEHSTEFWLRDKLDELEALEKGEK